MKITVLVENTTEVNGIEAEHGLSLFLETDEHKILFDMGQSDLFFTNAKKLGVDLSLADYAVLSHGHYDHGGGLRLFLDVNKKAPVYLRRDALGPYYNGAEKYIGLDTSLAECERLVFTDSEYVIGKGIILYSCNGMERTFDLGSFGLSKKESGKLVSDTFEHEQYLLMEENGKRVLVSGCSHKGIMNIVKWFEPDVLIGGFHFSKIPAGSALKACAEELNKYKTVYYTCHCTGTEQYRYMKKHMDNLYYLSAGQTITL
ncbi:MAG: MBL fold metallo-hydrolase [Clostridia bacterium]|nr:MBL fold metallo-hydrolase [Clostridia bacterium]